MFQIGIMGSISFLNVNTGIIAGGPGSIFIQTYDGGSTWIQRNTIYEMGKVQYIDSMLIYATGSYGVMKSTNGGVSWFLIDTSNFYLNFRSLNFINKDTGTVVGLHGLIKTTTDGGAVWTTRIIGFPIQLGDSTLFDVQYVNDQTIYACGIGGIVVKTTNGGISWIYKPSGSGSTLPALYFSDANTGSVVGYPYIGRTTNGGNSWISQQYPPNPSQEPLRDINFVNSLTGYIAGFNGTILYTSNGGFTWVKHISSELPMIFNLFQNYPNPFNPSTKIKFAIPTSPSKMERGTEGEEKVTLTIYDVLGREVATLVNEKLQPGTYEVEWPAPSGNASDFPSGVYFYKLETGDFSQTKKMVLMK